MTARPPSAPDTGLVSKMGGAPDTDGTFTLEEWMRDVRADASIHNPELLEWIAEHTKATV